MFRCLEKGHPRAAAHVALWHHDGCYGLPCDWPLARDLLREAALAGDVVARLLLELLPMKSVLLRPLPRHAMRRCVQGLVRAHPNPGACADPLILYVIDRCAELFYMSPLVGGEPENDYLAAAARMGLPSAMYAQALRLLQAGTKQGDQQAAWRLLQSTSEDGHVLSEYWVASHGRPLWRMNAEERMLELEAAAKRGLFYAQRDLARAYTQGLGVAPNLHKADRFMRMCALGGDAGQALSVAMHFLSTGRDEAARLWFVKWWNAQVGAPSVLEPDDAAANMMAAHLPPPAAAAVPLPPPQPPLQLQHAAPAPAPAAAPAPAVISAVGSPLDGSPPREHRSPFKREPAAAQLLPVFMAGLAIVK
jgi:TPR repeat protein